jgi:enoyl-CoA hydratase/carnithine racemase
MTASALPAVPALEPFQPQSGPLSGLDLLRLERGGPVFHLRLNRPAKRNSVSDEMLRQIHTVFVNLPSDVRALILSGEGDHFSAGLDLSEVSERTVAEGIHHSRAWHACFESIQFGPVPVIAVLHGAVVGGGLELAASAHIRVSEAGTFYALPEGTRGIFVGGGGSVRISRLAGTALMTDMMLTGRVLDANEGLAASLATYLVPSGQGLAKALELAVRIAGNAPLSNYAITQALPRISEMGPSEGLFVESLMSSIAQGDEAAKERVRAFLQKRAAKVERR